MAADEALASGVLVVESPLPQAVRDVFGRMVIVVPPAAAAGRRRLARRAIDGAQALALLDGLSLLFRREHVLEGGDSAFGYFVIHGSSRWTKKNGRACPGRTAWESLLPTA